MKNQKNKTKPSHELPLPPYIALEEDTDYGDLFSPVNDLAYLSDPRSHSEILAMLPKSDRAQAAKELNRGFHAVLLVDLASGYSAMEMRKHTPPSKFPPLTLEQKELQDAQSGSHEAYCAFRRAILREDRALEAAGIYNSETDPNARKANKKGKK